MANQKMVGDWDFSINCFDTLKTIEFLCCGRSSLPITMFCWIKYLWWKNNFIQLFAPSKPESKHTLTSLKTVKGNTKVFCIRTSFGTQIKQRINAINYRQSITRIAGYFWFWVLLIQAKFRDLETCILDSSISYLYYSLILV